MSAVADRAEAVFAQAKTHHLAGRLDEARGLYGDALNTASHPERRAEIQFRLGILEWQTGNATDALTRLDAALASGVPAQARFHFMRGQILHGLERWDAAAAAQRAALALDPHSADTWCALGNALQAPGDHDEAAHAYQRALALDPAHSDAANNLGNSLRARGALEDAAQAYRTALAAQPGHAGALTNLGTLLKAQGRLEQALGYLREAVRIAPHDPGNLINLGAAICDQSGYAEAAPLLERAVCLAPRNAQAAYNYGNALQGLGRYAEAAAQFRSTVALQPSHADAHNNLGNVCRVLGEFGAANEAFETALRLRPDSLAARNNAANLMRALGRHDAAEAHLRAALAISPAHSASLNNLGNVLKDSGALDEAIDCYRQAVSADARNVTAHSNLVYALSFQSESAAPILEEALRWSSRHEAPLAASAPVRTPRTVSAARRPIRIGYVGAEFRDHCQALFLLPLLAHHDHSRFEIICYASVARPDAVTQRLAAHADRWRDVAGLDDAQLAQTIANDEIDILVDLTMHMANGRLALFARKPAPIQVAWLAYPGTTGLAAMDYRLTDPYLDPPGQALVYRERTLSLADSFWCYDPLTTGPAVNALPAGRAGYVTFGCLNNACKLTDHTLRLWSGVFAALPEARLILMAPPGNGRDRLAARLSAHGLDPARVRFEPFRPRGDYLATYHKIDIGLDTFPYNGHTTSLDALWMGVPVVTRIGRTAVGRGGLSQLSNLDLSELAADSDAGFVATALALARNPARLADLRANLRTRLETSPLMDGARFARQMEAAYRRMLDDARAGGTHT
jgi:protein O-GlcNAc transferase